MTHEPYLRNSVKSVQDYFIDGIYFKNILSFDEFEIRDFKRVNVFIGENSSGKSNIIRAIIGFTPGGTGSRAKRYIDFYRTLPIRRTTRGSSVIQQHAAASPNRRESARRGGADMRTLRQFSHTLKTIPAITA